MSKKLPKNVESTVKFSGFSVLNENFTRCRCNIFYTGKNRNYTDITEEALQRLIDTKGYANVPVVAHLYKDKDGNVLPNAEEMFRNDVADADTDDNTDCYYTAWEG
jgi:hypothetical protein